ncbi:MAG: ATP-binding protein [Saprospiraceae bacterium]|nr:MAG: ATP-binding protein [Saprospiraceae bacterium]
MKIDLSELAYRENERIEWKENVADIEDVVKTIVAFSNDFANLGGGYVVCGAKEIKDIHGFPSIEYMGLISNTLQEVENKTLAHCREKVHPAVVPYTEVIEAPNHPGKRILIFIIPATKHAHSYRARSKDSSTYYIRTGSNTVEAKNGLLNELLVRKGQMEPWDKRVNLTASLNDMSV